jgi:DNA polymerase III delta prime subunit
MSLAEKYRPQKFTDLYGRDDIIEALVNFKKSNNIPNILMIGPAGTGKTTLAKLWIKYLHGNNAALNSIEQNSSDDTSIDVIRTKIKDFVMKKSIGSNIPKLIFLDECDKLSSAAQCALKKIMESYSARFILCANTDNIDNAIKSRCICFNFNPLKDEDIKNRLEQIIDLENIEVSESQLKQVIKNANGDLRQALNLLHATISGIELAEDINNYKILNLSVKEFEDKILYKYEGKKIIDKMFNEIIASKKYDKVSILANADYRISLQTIKTLQILDAFMQITE